ncbi:hypothetical protein [Brevundimonas faecalis]|uniref:Nucleotidyltransferase family protein n=1 Tax=Brevundimonas faecalis TaxID=947378 RepID=A0ABV2R986_9CAUL
MTDDLPDDIVSALDILVSTTTALQDPWWVFGGAAMCLWGLRDWHVPDIDVMCSPRDARRLIESLHGQVAQDPGEGLFRSQVFGQILTTPVPLDVMAGMDVRAGGDWTPVTFSTRVPVAVEDFTVFTPSVAEQIETCRLFGRPKDLQRAEMLEKLRA